MRIMDKEEAMFTSVSISKERRGSVNFDCVGIINKEIEKEDFMRYLLVTLGTDESTPIDIVDVRFGPVRESTVEAFICNVSVTGDCSASIGYDHKEPYIDFEKYREKIGDHYYERTRPVTKYRTVTDWSAYQESYSGTHSIMTENSAKTRFTQAELKRTFKAIINGSLAENITVGERKTVNPSALNRALKKSETHVEKQISLPGDRTRDVRYRSDSSVDKIVGYVFPIYEVTYTYQGEQYEAYGFAFDDPCIHYNAPTRKSTYKYRDENDIAKEAKKKTAVLSVISMLFWVVFFTSVAASVAACFLMDFCWLWLVSAALLICACLSNTISDKLYEKCAEKIALDYARHAAGGEAIYMTEKVEALEAALAREHYAPLQKEERPAIDGVSDHAVNRKLPRTVFADGYTGKMITGIVLCVVLIITSLVVNNRLLHSPKQMELDLVGKSVYFDPDKYVNGCYYIDLDFEVSAKNNGVDYTEFKVYISEKDGTELGYVRVTLSDMRIDAGEKKVIGVTLSENQPENNEFFTNLYNADLSNLEFEFEIGDITFTDHERYHNEDYNEFS